MASSRANPNDVIIQIANVQKDIQWIKKIGYVLMTALVGSLFYLIEFEIPRQTTAASDKIASKIPDNLDERLTKLETKFDELKTRFGSLTPGSLQLLIPPRGEQPNPSELQARLQRANHVIDTAFELSLPGDPKQLSALSARLDDVKARYSDDPMLAAPIMSSEAHLASYRRFSSAAIDTDLSLQTQHTRSENSYNGLFVIANITFDCKAAQTGAVGGEVPAISHVMLYNVTLIDCWQRQIAYFTWVRANFEHATIFYHGGPLTVVNSTFKNCSFSFGDDPQSREALNIIREAGEKPVSIYFKGPSSPQS